MKMMVAGEEHAEEGAAYWFARLRADSASPAERDAFLRWIAADPSHEDAYRNLQALWEDLGDTAGHAEIQEMRREALDRAPARPRWSWQPLSAIAATLVLLAAAGLILLNRPLPGLAPPAAQMAEASGPRMYRTAIGARSAVTLADGSNVELNTDSVIEVDFSGSRRDVKLLRGQALFDVAHDAERPFIVEAAGQKVTAVGTAFDVRVDAKGMRVTLIEGKVAVAPVRTALAAEAQPVRMLAPGQQLVAAADRSVQIVAAKVDQATSWRSGRVIFEDEPLGDVVEEVNRYTQRKIVLADPAAARIRVSGVFRAGSVGSFVTALDAAFPIEVEQYPEEILLRSE